MLRAWTAMLQRLIIKQKKKKKKECVSSSVPSLIKKQTNNILKASTPKNFGGLYTCPAYKKKKNLKRSLSKWNLIVWAVEKDRTTNKLITCKTSEQNYIYISKR